MIDIKQLRLGNYVMYEQTTHVVTAMSRTLIETEWAGGTENYIHLPEELDPIPLTEEVLLRCGFEKDNYKKGHIGIDYKSGEMTFDFVLEEPGFMGEWDKHYTFELPGHRFVNVEYLHQLQNIFFAITGKELEYVEG